MPPLSLFLFSNTSRPVSSTALPLSPGPSSFRHHPLPPFQHHPLPSISFSFSIPTPQHLLSSDAPQLLSTAILAPSASLPFGIVQPNKIEQRAFIQSCLADALRSVLFSRCPSFGPIWPNDVEREGGTVGQRERCQKVEGALKESRC